jgi:uncharacterized protein
MGSLPLPDLTTEAAPGRGLTGWSGIPLACTGSTRLPVAASVSAGATPVAVATDRSWGGCSAFIADPEGNRRRSSVTTATYDARAAPCCPGTETG